MTEAIAPRSAGNAQDIKPLAPQVQTQATVGSPDFVGAFSALASTPTLLGTIGAQMAQSASTAFNSEMGRRAGSDPYGEPLPPITKADEAYVNAYLSQSQVTLGLQAQDLINKSKTEVSKGYLLSEGGIAAFQQNTMQGLNSIMEKAPNAIKGSLQAQYEGQIQNTASSLLNQLNTQNKNIESSKAAAWRMEQSIKMQDLLHDNTPESMASAKVLQQQIISNIKSNAAIGMITPLQAQTALHEANVNFQTGAMSGKAFELYNKNDGSLEEYLSQISTQKIKGMSWAESQQVAQGVLKSVSALDSLQNRNQQLLYTTGGYEINSLQMTPQRMAELETKMHPVLYTQLKSQYVASQARGSNKAQQLNSDVRDYTNGQSTLWRQGTGERQNAAFQSLATTMRERSEQTQNPISQDEAEYRVAINGPKLPPSYKHAIENGLTSGNPVEMNHFGDIYQKLMTAPGLKALEIDSKSASVYRKYTSLLQEGKDPQTAAQEAKRLVMSPTDAESQMAKQYAQRYMNKQFTSPDATVSHLSKLMGISADQITNKDWFRKQAADILLTEIEAQHGDTKAAEQTFRDHMSKVWKNTSLNGDPNEITLFPIETIAAEHGLGSESQALFKADMALQLENELDRNNQLYQASGMNMPQFRYEIIRPKYDEYIAAKKAVIDNGASDKNYYQNIATIRAFQDNAPVLVKRVGKDGTQKIYELNAQASPYTTIDMNTKNVIGGYDMMLIDPDTGRMEPFVGMALSEYGLPRYQPNFDWIKERVTNTLYQYQLPGLDELEVATKRFYKGPL
jgi:hypothetical protein